MLTVACVSIRRGSWRRSRHGSQNLVKSVDLREGFDPSCDGIALVPQDQLTRKRCNVLFAMLRTGLFRRQTARKCSATNIEAPNRQRQSQGIVPGLAANPKSSKRYKKRNGESSKELL